MLWKFKGPRGKLMERKEKEEALSAELPKNGRKNNPPSKPVVLPARGRSHPNAKSIGETAVALKI